MGYVVTRTPGVQVRRALSAEVGFHCPADRDGDICGIPYLTWHHFDPPWAVEEHQRPEGMIALCRAHADKADNGSYTDDQLRRLKREGVGRGRAVAGRFDWMRRDLLAIVGGNAYLRTPVLVRIGERNAVWFTRNDLGEQMLNFVMPTLSGQPRASIQDNNWVIEPTGVSDLTCPPGGRLVAVRYANGDLFRVEFRSVDDAAQLAKAVPHIPRLNDLRLEYPVTVVELSQKAAGSTLQLTPRATHIGTNTISGSVMADCGAGIHVSGIGEPPGGSDMADLLQQARQDPRFRD